LKVLSLLDAGKTLVVLEAPKALGYLTVKTGLAATSMIMLQKKKKNKTETMVAFI